MKRIFKPLAGLIALFVALSMFTGCEDNITWRNIYVPSGDINFATDYNWDTDVVIVGGGGAGFSAAVIAARAGLNVTVVEMLNFVGGNTLHAGGSMNAFHPEFQWRDLPAVNLAFTDSDRELIEEAIIMDVNDQRFAHLNLSASRRAEINGVLSYFQAGLLREWNNWNNNIPFSHTWADGTTTNLGADRVGYGVFDSPYLHFIQTWESGDFSGCPVLTRLMTFGAQDAFRWLYSFPRVTSGSTNPDAGAPGTLVGSLWRRNVGVAFPVGSHPAPADVRGIVFPTGMGNAFVLPQAEYFLRQRPATQTRLLLNHEALEILVDDSGRAVGVAGRQPGGTFTVNAGAVIIATGGFGGNPAMLDYWQPREEARYFTGFTTGPLAAYFPPRHAFKWDNINRFNTTNVFAGMTGEGIMMAYRAGAALSQMQYIQLVPENDNVAGDRIPNPDWDGESLGGYVPGFGGTLVFSPNGTTPEFPYLPSQAGWPGTLMINELGQRIVNETGRRDEIALAWISQNLRGGRGIAVGGPSSNAAAVGTNLGVTVGIPLAEQEALISSQGMTDAIAYLAASIHPGNTAMQNTFITNFTMTLDNHNMSFWDPANVTDAARKFVKNHAILPPFHHVPMRPPRIHHTMGGIAVNEHMQVIRQDGRIFTGLYAAGEVIGGLHGSNRVGGNALTDVLVFGKIAGAHAVEFVEQLTNN